MGGEGTTEYTEYTESAAPTFGYAERPKLYCAPVARDRSPAAPPVIPFRVFV